MTDRPKKLYFKIGVVARFLKESRSCVRYWLKIFHVSQKRGANDRFWRHLSRENIGTLVMIRHLLRDKHMSIYEAKIALSDLQMAPDPTSEEQLRLLRMGIDGSTW